MIELNMNDDLKEWICSIYTKYEGCK